MAKLDNISDLSGKLLIAMPGIDDERFERTVILLCAHSDEHAMGIVLNKAMSDLTVAELLEQLNVPNGSGLHDPIVIGGPVGKDRGFVLHTEDFETIGATIPVTNGIRLTATKEILHALASSEPPARSRLALGYSGWGPQQLEAEIRENVWLVVDADDEIIFDSDFSGKWERAVNMLGISPDKLQGGTVGTA